MEKLLQQVWDYLWTLASETVERFTSELEIYSETCNTDAQYRIFKIATGTIWEFLDNIKAIERWAKLYLRGEGIVNKQAITNTLKSLQETIRKHSPAILTGIGIAGMTAAAIMAVKTTPRAPRMVDNREIGDKKRLTASEIVKTAWKCYIPTAVTGIRSAACIIGASSISVRRNAVLVTAYTVSETALGEYKGRAVEVVGPKKEQAIQGAVAKERLGQTEMPERKFIPTDRSKTPCFDPLTNACFRSDYETLRGVEDTLNKRLRDEVRVTVSDFLEELGLPSCDPAIGDNLGWDMDKGWVEFNFGSRLVDDISYLVIGHCSLPRYIDW